MIELGVAYVVLAEKFRCDNFSFRPAQLHVFLLRTDSHRSVHDIDPDKCLALLGKRPVDEQRRGVGMSCSTRQQLHLRF